MKPFNILPPRIDLVDKAGSVAREWWRWFNAIQEVTGGGASGTLGDLAIQAEIQSPHGNDYDAAIGDTNKLLQAPAPHGPDYDRSIAEATKQFLSPSPHGTDYDTAIADLRKRLETLPRGVGGNVAINVADLQALILSLPRPRDPQPDIDINMGQACCDPKGLDPLLAMRSWARSDWQAGYVASIGSGVTLAAGVLTASGASGTVTSIVAGAGLAGGTITTAGTISLATIAASSLMGNASGGAAVPTTITIGSNLTLSVGGTLSASAGAGTVTTVSTTGAGISGGPITTAGTLSVQWNGGSVTGLGDGVAISAGNVLVDTQASQTVAGATATVTPASGTTSVAVTLQANTTLTIANGNYAGQHLRLKLIQDGTGSRTVAFDSSVKFGTDITLFTASTAANAIDLVQLIWDSTNSRWDFAASAHGF